MEKLVNRFKVLLNVQNDRSKNILRHVGWSVVFKIGSILSNFLLVPITIGYLSAENYGIWLTLSSFVAWFSFFDIGLGNGLRNKFAEAKTLGDNKLAKGFVSTAYFTLGTLCIILLALSVSASFLIDWKIVFNISSKLGEELEMLMPLVFGCFSLQLLFNLVISIFLANQNHSIAGKIGFLTSVSSLLAIWLITKNFESSLLIFGIVISALPVVIMGFLNFYAFRGPLKEFAPQYSYWKREYFKDIFGQGISFFLIQISVIILVSTDNLIITLILGSEAVVPYNIAYKYMGIAHMVFGIIVAPFWSSFTEAFTIKDILWVKNSMKNLLKIVIMLSVLTFVMLFTSSFVYEIWIGDQVVVPFGLTAFMGLYYILTIIYSPFIMFINGVGKVRVQMYVLIFGALLNIPLSIILLKYSGLGVEAVILATTICILPCLVFYPIQYNKIIHNKAYGLWGK